MDKYDVAIIGSGPGGYVCAIRCAQLGFKTAIIERYPTLGGTCLNVGCIPSKAFLESSERYYDLVKHGGDHGIEAEKISLDFSQMVGRVGKVVDQTCQGVEYLMKKNDITVLYGHGSFKSKNIIQVKSEKQTREIEADKVVIATGSKPATLPGVEIDKERIISSTKALKLDEVPQHLIVIGGGYIGLEMGSVYRRLGAEVTVVEYMDSIVPLMDHTLAKHLYRSLKKMGMKFHLQHKVTGAEREGEKVVVKAENMKKEEEVSFEGDYCLVAVGRKPYTKGLELDKIGLKTNDRGYLTVDEHLQTEAEGIYAIGDVIDRGPMLAHKAEEDGVFVAEAMAGQKPHLDYNLVPAVVYTWPEVASVGKTEEELKEEEIPYKKGEFPFKASGRARAGNESAGAVKVLAHKETDEILGVHMVGPRAADMIGEAVLAMEYRASAEDVARTCHAHPTYTEAFKEAALAATEDRALHI